MPSTVLGLVMWPHCSLCANDRLVVSPLVKNSLPAKPQRAISNFMFTGQILFLAPCLFLPPPHKAIKIILLSIDRLWAKAGPQTIFLAGSRYDRNIFHKELIVSPKIVIVVYYMLVHPSKGSRQHPRVLLSGSAPPPQQQPCEEHQAQRRATGQCHCVSYSWLRNGVTPSNGATQCSPLPCTSLVTSLVLLQAV